MFERDENDPTPRKKPSNLLQKHSSGNLGLKRLPSFSRHEMGQMSEKEKKDKDSKLKAAIRPNAPGSSNSVKGMRGPTQFSSSACLLSLQYCEAPD